MKTIGQINAAIYRNMQILIGSKLTDLEIKAGQSDFFFVISNYEGMSQKQLSEHLCIGKSTTAKAVKNLVSNGYIYKEKDKDDRRVDKLYLTERGKKVAPDVRSIFEENLEVAARNLNKTEKQQLLSLMNKVIESLMDENKLNERI